MKSEDAVEQILKYSLTRTKNNAEICADCKKTEVLSENVVKNSYCSLRSQ